MFNLGGGELILVALAALLLIKPKNLPQVATSLGRWYAQLRSALLEVKSSFENSLRENPPVLPKNQGKDSDKKI